MREKVYVLLLNWNGWSDTIECLESVFRNDYLNYRVIVCDNDSKDDSLRHIKMWAKGGLDAVGARHATLKGLVTPQVTKPISYFEYDRANAETGGDKFLDPPLVLIRTGGNLGYAGGNNVGIRYAQSRQDFKYIWLLNNDTIIQKDSLSHLVERCRNTPEIGICGSTLLYYDHPCRVQAFSGASYNKWFGIAKNVGFMRRVIDPISSDAAESKIDYVIGASMLVSSEFLCTVGLMNEKYFLYYEELDWATRATGKFVLGHASRSIVFHKEGASIGSKLSKSMDARFRSEKVLIKSRIRFTVTYFPYAIPTVYMGLLITFLVRIIRGQWSRAVMLARAVWANDGGDIK